MSIAYFFVVKTQEKTLKLFQFSIIFCIPQSEFLSIYIAGFYIDTFFGDYINTAML